MAHQLPALLEIDIGLEDASDVTANQIATKLDLGLTPSLPVVVGADGNVPIAGLPTDAADALARSNLLADRIMDELEANMDIGNRQARALADAIVTGVEADQITALQSDTADLKAQNQTIEIFEALGGHMAAVDRAKDARAFEIELEALLEKRTDILDDEHVGIGIIDNVINGFRVNRTERALEATVLEATQNQQDIVNATVNTEAAAKSNALVKQTANEGTIVANQRKIAASGAAGLYEATLVQNRSNADTLQAMLATSNQEMSNIMRGHELSNSIESREIRRRQQQLAEQRFIRETIVGDVAIKRARLALRRETLETEIGEATATEKQQALLDSFAQQRVALDQSILNLSEAEETSENRIAQVLLARATAETNLDAANLAFEQAENDAVDPQVLAAKQAALRAAITSADRAEFEFNELEETAGLRQATREGALETQGLNILTLERNERIQAALEDGRLIEAQALLEEALKDRADVAAVEANNFATVSTYQSFIFGAHAVETSEVINAKLASGDVFYILMRQLGSAHGPNGEFILGITPARANAFLLMADQQGVVSNDITGVRILREVRAILQKEDADNPNARPQDDAGLAIRFNKTAEEYQITSQTEIVPGDVTNPFQPPTIPQMIKLSSTLAEQPLFSKVLIPEGNVDTNVDNIMAKGLVAMQANTLSQEQVVEGIVAMGNVIGINNNVNHHGMATIGLPYVTSVNMRVLRPRGFTASVLDSIQSSLVADVVLPLGIGIITAGAVLAAPVSGGSSLAVGSAGVSALTAATLGTVATGATAAALQESSDFITLNIVDPVAVRQHLIAILSSSTLGGRDTEDVLEAVGGGE